MSTQRHEESWRNTAHAANLCPTHPRHLHSRILQHFVCLQNHLPPSRKKLQARVILQEPFYARKAADFAAGRTGAAVLVAPGMAGGGPGASGYLAMLDNVIGALSAAL
jgi:hypothetical protein